MIRPKVRAIEGERTAREWNSREIFYLRSFLSRIEARDPPVLVRFFHAAQDVNQSIHEDMTGNFRANINDTQDVSTRIKFQDALLVPLTQIKMIAVVA
jgi:hypothetical protein